MDNTTTDSYRLYDRLIPIEDVQKIIVTLINKYEEERRKMNYESIYGGSTSNTLS